MALPANVAIEWLKQPADGGVVLIHCPVCKNTEILWDRYLTRPKDGGDLWVMRLECLRHIGLPPVEFEPAAWPWGFFKNFGRWIPRVGGV